MRNRLIAASLLLLAPAVADAQSASPGSRDRRRACEECAQDSTRGIVRTRRIERRDRRDLVIDLSRELSAVRRALGEEQSISAGERRRLEARAKRLQAQLAGLGAELGLEITARAMRDMQPGMVDAQRAVEAAMAEAGIAAARAWAPEGGRFAGWLGITLDAPCTVEMRDGDVFWRFLEQPQIVSVDPSSPADRAGIRQGDVLLAYDGQDVRSEIAMNRLLQPGRTVRVRVRVRRENNEVRELPVKIAPARQVAWQGWAPPASPVVPPRGSRSRSPRRPQSFTVVVPEAADPAAIADPGMLPSPLVIRRMFGLAGARMETITPGLAEAIGVERGVLVLSVPRGVPAQESGLIDGDVILKADGRAVATVQELRAALAGSDEKAVKLDVARKGKVRTVTLRW